VSSLFGLTRIFLSQYAIRAFRTI